MSAILRNGSGLSPVPKTDHFGVPLSAEQVFHDYGSRVYNTARRMLRNDLDAEDVTQDVLLQVVRHLPAFRGESAFPTWLHRITINAALTHRRKASVREERRLRDPLDVLLEDERGHLHTRRWMHAPEMQLIAQETKRVLEGAVAALPEMYGRVFVLSEIEGLPNQEIAEQLEMSLPAVKSRLHRARQMLRDVLTPHFDELLA